MENIRQAVERAKARERGGAPRQRTAAPDGLSRSSEFERAPSHEFERTSGSDKKYYEVALNSAVLQSNRIIAQGVTNPLSRSFDMLRTQVLQSMDTKNQRILAVTSPTPACGKTVTAVNLALSVARQTERSVLIVDLDFRKPKVASCLGLEFGHSVLSVLDGRSSISEAIVQTRIDSQQLMVLPTASTPGASELMASRAMAAMFQDLRREFSSQIVIVDLPPILSSDDVISILPQVDCVLLVVAVGTSKVSDIEECNKHLHSAEVVRIVVNKVREANAPYYSHY